VNVLELLRLALSRLRTSRLRAALTMLGVIIGVASVVALVGVGQGTTSNITSRLASLGTNLLTISPSGGASTLTLEDAAAIAKVDGVAAVAPELQTSASIRYGTKSTTSSVVGTNADYAQVRAYDVWQGSFLTAATVDRGVRVAVLGATTAEDLGLDATSLGATVTVNGLPVQVIGILQPKGGAGFNNPDDQVLVPLAAVSKYFVAGDTVRTIGVSVASDDRMTEVTDAITALLRNRHDLGAT
jgi:putative ABC transport system permease protein